MSPTDHPLVTTVELAPVSLIDSVVFGEHSWLDRDHAWQRDLRLTLVRESFVHHVESCNAYQAFAHRLSVGPDDIQSYDDLVRIPQFPTSVFKRQAVLSVPPADVVRSFTSSGTAGVRSVIHRDGITLYRLCGMMRPDSPLFGGYLDGMDESNSVVLNLGPSRSESGGVWFSYVMSLLEQLAPMVNYLVGGEVRLADAIVDAQQALTENDRVFLVGPPFLIADLCREVEARGEPLHGGDSLLVFTGGGWKARESERIDRPQFVETVTSALHLSDTAQVRDVFNQVELNTLLIECDRHQKHVPPWVHAFARDPASFEPLPDGQFGVLSFSDATAHSYPCFMVGDDLGRVRGGTCECGRAGPTLDLARRLRGSAHAGCAETMASNLGRSPRLVETDTSPEGLGHAS